jgi:hypothetical protein
MVETTTPHARKLVESLLENEALSADLDDAAAQALLDWAIDCAERISRETESLGAIASEEAEYPRLRALRKLMRSVNSWISGREAVGAGGDEAFFIQIVSLAQVIYGEDFNIPSEEERQTFAALPSGPVLQPVEFVQRLRRVIENRISSFTE